MAHYSKLVTSLIFLFSASAFAGYAQVTPPVNWTESAGKYFYKTAANDVFKGASTVLTNASLNVGGRTVVVPAAMRFASNAPRFLATAVSLNPAWLVAGLAAPYLVDWLLQKKIRYNEVSQSFFMETKTITELATLDCQGGPYSGSVSSIANQCSAALASYYKSEGYSSCKFTVGINTQSKTISLGYTEGAPCGGYHNLKYTSTITEAGSTRIIGDQEFIDEMAPVPIPLPLPKFIPIPLPVDEPVINPSPSIKPQPLRVPQGEPQLVPNSDPKRWQQPSIDIVPSPTPDSPWRVDVQPKKIESPDGQPLPPTSTPSTNKPFLPDGSPNPDYDPAQEPNANEKPTPEEQQDLCEKNPDILACQKPSLGSVDPDVIVDSPRSLSIDKDSGWGPENGTCPPPKTVQVLGVTLGMPFTMLCDFAAGIRPLLIAFAWLSAIGGFIGIGRRE